MFARKSIHIPLSNRQGDQFVLTDEHSHFSHERLEFKTRQEAWDFIFALNSSQALQERLKAHPSMTLYHQAPGGLLLGKALEKGNLKVFVTHRDQRRNLEEINKLYDQIKLKLNQIIASEKAEAAVIDKQYQALSPAEQKMAHAGSFGKGLADAGISFLIWVKDVVEVVAPPFKLIRKVIAYHDTPYDGSVFDWIEKSEQNYREGEYRELVEALGFDPQKIKIDDFKQAWEIAQIIWDDEKCHSLLVQFTKDYYKAQHPLEASEFVGGAAFEVLLTILLILTTAGAGAVANVASKGRLVRQMGQLGDLFRDLARLKKTVHKQSPKKPMRSRLSGDMTKDLPADDRPAPKTSAPPKGEKKAEADESESLIDNNGFQGDGKAVPPQADTQDKFAKPQPAHYQDWGLTNELATREYIADVKTVFNNWENLSADERMTGLEEAVNKQLSNAGVPGLKISATPLPTGSNGNLDFPDWQIILNENLTNKPQLSETEQKQLADTLYHEARHGEQWWEMGRYYAAAGHNPEDLGIEPSIAAKAKANPIPQNSPKLVATREMYDNVYGNGAPRRNKILTNLNDLVVANQNAANEYTAIEADPNATKSQKDIVMKKWQQAYQAQQANYAAYRALPEEVDAWVTGNNVQQFW